MLRVVTAAVCLSAILVTSLSAFLVLDANSFWFDELYTAWIIDTDAASFSELIAALAVDTNPPGYFLVAWAAMAAFGGDEVIVLRAMSACAAAMALVLVYLAPPEGTSRTARLIGAAVAATSGVWMHFALDARSYALCLLCAAAMALAAIRVMAAYEGRARAPVWLGLLTAASVAGAFLNYYVILAAGGLCAGLLLFAPDWRMRIAVVLTGLAILLPVLMLVGWQSEYRGHDFSATHFKSTLAGMTFEFVRGLRFLVGSKAGGLALAVLALFIAAAAPRAWARGGDGRWRIRATLVLVSGAGLSVVFGVLASLVYLPLFQARVLVISAPFIGVAIGLLADLALRDERAVLAKGMMLSAAFFTALLATKVLWRDLPYNDPYREGAAIMARRSACADSPAIAAMQRNSGFARFTYMFYLNRMSPERTLLFVDQADRDLRRLDPATEAALARRASGEDACPVLLWGVRSPTLAAGEFRDALAGRYFGGDVERIDIVRLLPPGPTRLQRFIGASARSDNGFALLLRGATPGE